MDIFGIIQSTIATFIIKLTDFGVSGSSWIVSLIEPRKQRTDLGH